MKFIELNEKDYQLFLKNYENKKFLQSVEMANVNKQTGNDVCYLGIKKDNKVIAASLFIIKFNKGKKYYYSPRGLQVDYSDKETLSYFVNSLKEYVKNNNGYLLKIDPYIELFSRDSEGNVTDELNNNHILKDLEKLGFKYLNYSVQKKWFYVLDLKNKTKDEVFNSFRSTVKNIIRKCQKNMLEIEEITTDFHRFSNIVDETAERKNFKVRDDNYYQLMKKEFKNSIKIYIAKINLDKYLKVLIIEKEELEKSLNTIKGEGKRKNQESNITNLEKAITKAKAIKKDYGKIIDLAASMFCFYGNEVVYLYSGSKEEFLFLNAPYLLQWHIIQEAISKQYPMYNFYGIEDLSDKRVKSKGVYEFKKGFNGRVIETIGELDLYINKIDKIKYYLKKVLKKIKQ